MGTSTLYVFLITVAFMAISEGVIYFTKRKGLRKGTIPVFWTLLVVTLTIYPVAELSRFITAFYGFFGWDMFIVEFGLMFIGYVTGIAIVFGLATKRL